MESVAFQDTVSGHSVIAGTQVSGGTVNFTFAGPPLPIRTAPKPFSTIPFPSDPAFIQRPAISQWIREATAAVGSRAALVGLGGVGKSQMVIQHAYSVRQEAPQTWVFWVHASSVARFLEAYQDIAERLQLPGRDDPQQNVLQLVYRWLTNEDNGPWLLIVDNADDIDILKQSTGLPGSERPVASYIPKTGQGSVLVTSRSTKAAEMLVGEDSLLQVSVMDAIQAKDLLRSRVGKDLYDDSSAASLVEALDCLPLAIIQAASFIKKRKRRGATLSSYLEDFSKSKKKKSGLLSREATDLRRDDSASKAVVTTWQITFDQVRRDRVSAAELLFLMSFFHPQGIPESVLNAFYKNIVDKDGGGDEDEDEDEGGSEDHGLGNNLEDGLEDDLEVLISYSLVAIADEGHTLEMHALVQFCTQVWLSTFDDLEKWRCRYIKIVSSEYPFANYDDLTVCRKLAPHIAAAIEQCPASEADIWSWSELLNKVGSYHFHKGEPREAEKMNRWVLNIRKTRLGESHPQTLESMTRLAACLYHQGKVNEAYMILKQTIEMGENVLGTKHPQTLLSKSWLELVLRAQGKIREALRITQWVLEARTEVLGGNHPDTLISMQTLAEALLRNHSGYIEAEALTRKVLKEREESLGEKHLEILISKGILGLCLLKQKKYSESEHILRWVLDIQSESLGYQHHITLVTMDSLASVYHEVGKYTEAEKLRRWIFQIRKEGFGAEERSTRFSMYNLAQTCWSKGQKSEAVHLMRSLGELEEKILGPDHPYTRRSRWILEEWESKL